jgi:hypothetical protein
MAVWLSFAILGLSMSTNALSQSQKFLGGTLSWTVSENSQTYNRFTLNHLVFTGLVFNYRGSAYPVPGSATYVTCTSSYQDECAGYPKIEAAFFWLAPMNQYVLFDPSISGTEQQAKSAQRPAPHHDSDQASIESSSHF